MRDEQVTETLRDVIGSEAARHDEGQAPSREHVDQREHPKRPAILRPVLDEVVRPEMIGSLLSQTNARPVVAPETAALVLLRWDFQPFPSPDPVDPLVAHVPAVGSEHLANPPIAIAPMCPC